MKLPENCPISMKSKSRKNLSHKQSVLQVWQSCTLDGISWLDVSWWHFQLVTLEVMKFTLIPRELNHYELLERKSKFPENIGDSYFVPIFEELWDELENTLDFYFCLDPVNRFNEIKPTFLSADKVQGSSDHSDRPILSSYWARFLEIKPDWPLTWILFP